LTDKLLARTEELREVECQRDAASRELARAREEAFTASAAGQQSDSSRGGEPTRATTKGESRRIASPVLGSVIEQFGKLREQRSLNRSNGKPRLI
jgi:septal ring factor EnvC (AmiA/AmiB activator)